MSNTKEEMVPVPEEVTIPKEEYEELLSDQQFLQCLQGAGVDSWEGYDDAQEAMDL